MKRPVMIHDRASAQRGLLLSVLLLSSSIDGVSSRERNKYGPWNMPSSFLSSQQAHSFMTECESLASFIWKVRGGGRDDNYYYDDSSIPPPGRYYYDDDEQEDEYSDYKRSSSQPDRRGTRSREPAFLANMPSVIKNGNRQIGLGLLGSGSLITMLGISLFFNKTLMRLGNLLFIAGVPMTLGPHRTLGYLVKPEKFRATGCLALGMFLVFIGMPLFGIILEAFGILNLFGNLFPLVWAVAKNMPGIGPLLSNNKSNSNQKSRRHDRYSEPQQDEGPYYEDEYGRNDEDPYYGDRRSTPPGDNQYY